MRIPFEIPAKGMKDADKSRGKSFRFTVFVEEAENNTSDCGKKTV